MSGNPDFLRKVASEMRHDRNLRGAMELEAIADKLERDSDTRRMAKTEGLGSKTE